MVKAVSDGSVAGDFIALAVAADIDAPCSPCGICRQFIRGRLASHEVQVPPAIC